MKNELNAGALAGDAIALAKLSEDEFSSIYAELENLPLLLNTSDDVYSVLLDKNLLNGENAAGDFIIYVLFEVANRGDKPLVRLFERVMTSVQRQLAESGTNGGILEVLTQRIEQLARLRNVVGSIKAGFLFTERERTFRSSKIISDLRPVFEEGLTTSSFLILNTLALEYQEGEKKTTLHIAMDAEDIDSLILQLERAKRKAETIKSTFSLNNISIIE